MADSMDTQQLGRSSNSNGQVSLDGTNASPSSLNPNDPFAGNFARLNTNRDPTSTQGLKINQSFTLSGTFDLIIPEERDAYGIELNDVANGSGNDIVRLEVRGGTNGVTSVLLQQINLVTGSTVNISSAVLNPSAQDNEIVLTLSYTAPLGATLSTSGPQPVSASFQLLMPGSVPGTEVPDGSPITLSNTATIFATENWTQAQFFAFAPAQSDTTLIGTYGTLDLTQTGTWTYQLANEQANVQALAQGQTVQEHFNIVVTDDHGASTLQPVTVTVTGTNDAPVVAHAIADQSSPIFTVWSYQVPANAFSDVDNATLSYTATLGNDSPLPAWLSFNATTRTFSGTPPQGFSGALDLKVTASDGSVSVSDTFTLSVTAATIAGQATGSVTEDVASALQTSGTLTLSGNGATPVWSITGGATAPQTQDFRFQVDNLKVIKNGSVFFEDTFGDGLAPPLGPNFPPTPGTGATVYTAQGALTEADGRAFFDGTQAITFGTTNYGDRMLLNSDISPISDPVNGTKGLKSNSDFTTEARFDLIMPEDSGDVYGVRLTDQNSTAPNNDSSVDLVVLRDATGVHVQFRQINLSTSTNTAIQTVDLAPGAGDQIVLRLNYDHNSFVSTTAGGSVTASFDLMSNGVVTSTTNVTEHGHDLQERRLHPRPAHSARATRPKPASTSWPAPTEP